MHTSVLFADFHAVLARSTLGRGELILSLITRAGVQHRIDSGSLLAVRVGNAWAIPAAAVPAP